LSGQFPLIIIAHGGLRVAPNMVGWLASMLAANGFIAVVTNPPKIPSEPPKQSILNELWLRPGDLSAAITATEKDPVFGKLVDGETVAGVGSSWADTRSSLWPAHASIPKFTAESARDRSKALTADGLRKAG
jgi:predicted dienelactone hydrolase